MMMQHPGHPEDPRRRFFDEDKSKRAIEFVLHAEGGELTMDPDDPGGKTRWGISLEKDRIDPEKLTRAQAAAIHKDRYWIPIKGPSLPPAVGMALMDYAVHSGVWRAAHLIQEIVRVERDGIIGPLTLDGVTRYVGDLMVNSGGISFEAADVEVAVGITQRRMLWLCGIVISKPDKRLKYLHGWMSRVFNLQRELLEYYRS